MNLVLKVKPHQATLVPDPPEAITSNAGWDTINQSEIIEKELLRSLNQREYEHPFL
jgi:pyridoxine 5-phosphate synthase